MDIKALILSLLLGVMLDRLLGDPVRLPHPVVGFGKMIAFLERRLNRGRHKVLKGALSVLLLVVSAFAMTLLLVWGAFRLNYWAGVAVSGICVFFCLAGKTLEDEVAAVFRAADDSLEKGRSQVARIVGRDTSELSDREVRTAALETLAENLSDGVIAPLFWFLVLGVPGMMAYKMVNTLDSMIGYKNERYLDFGRWAARTDDLANWIPARLTALLMIAGGGCRRDWAFVKRYGREHASPNSGYPESALAAILDCRFGGPHLYFGEMVEKPFIGETDRDLGRTDLKLALTVNRRAERIMVVAMVVAYCLIYVWY